jgi:hypothetical protein
MVRLQSYTKMHKPLYIVYTIYPMSWSALPIYKYTVIEVLGPMIVDRVILKPIVPIASY